MARSIAGALLSIVICGCTSVSVTSRPPVTLDGIGSDLRVFINDSCVKPDRSDGEVRSFGVDTLAQVAVGFGSTVLKSFGQMLGDLGATKIDRSTAIASGFLYAPLDGEALRKIDAKENNDSENPVELGFSRSARCIHVVREGFSSGGRKDTGVPADVRTTWDKLGLIATPSFYALIGLETAQERPDSSLFRGRLLFLTAQDFERPGARQGDRDYLLFLDFESPAKSRYYKIEGSSGKFVEQGGVFARGGLRLPLVSRGAALGMNELKGLETGWMTAPGLESAKAGGAFNLFVDLIEVKRGDPFIADLGALLKSDPVVNAFESDLKKEFETESAQKARIRLENAAEDQQITATRALDAAASALRVALDAGKATPEKLRELRYATEDAIREVEQQRRVDGWIGAFPRERIDEARNLIARASQ